MSFSYREALQFGWKTFWGNLWLLVKIGLVFVAVMIAFGVFQETAGSVFAPMTVLVGIGAWIVQILIGMGVLKIFLMLHSQEEVKVVDMFSQSALIWKFLGGIFLVMLIVLAGLFLLIIPGIIWAIKYQFVPFLIIDQGLGPMEALKKSGEMTDGHKWELLGFSIVLGLVNFLGFAALIIGQLVTGPVSALARVHVYRELLKATELKHLAAVAEEPV